MPSAAGQGGDIAKKRGTGVPEIKSTTQPDVSAEWEAGVVDCKCEPFNESTVAVNYILYMLHVIM